MNPRTSVTSLRRRAHPVALPSLAPALALIALAACGGPAADSGRGNAGALRPIPLEVVFANPAVRHPRLSPDGREVAWIADRDGAPNIWTRPLDGGTARPVTAETEDGIDAFTWAADGSSILYLRDRRGDRRYGLYGADPATGATTELASFDDTQVHLLGVAESRPHEVLLSMNRENEERFDVYRLDARTGELALEVENPGFLGSPSGPQATWHVDRDLEVRAALGERADGGVDLYARAGREWVRLGSWSLELGEPAVVSAGAERLWLLDPRDGNTARLRSIGLDGDAAAPVAGDSTYDVDAVLMAPDANEPLAAAVYRERRTWTPLDPTVRDDFAALEGACAGDLSIESRAAEDRLWLTACDRSDSPGSYLLLRRDSGIVETLFVRRPGLDEYGLAPKEPVRFEARDGLPIHGYMTLPLGRPRADLPAVVLVHGGPWARDRAGYDPTVQWLASRGYLVLQVNFRGSTGYGHRFAAAGARELGGAMQDDVTDALGWAVREGLVDPDRVAIMGGSYGGYAALAGLAFTPDLYRAGISIVGFGNLITLMERVAPMFRSSVSFFHSYVGNPETDAEVLRRRSPYFHVDSIRAPVLMGHGRNDPLVPVEESEAMARALEARGVPVELVVWPDEGHGLTNPANRLSFYGLAERFLACHVLGREDACPPRAERDVTAQVAALERMHGVSFGPAVADLGRHRHVGRSTPCSRGPETRAGKAGAGVCRSRRRPFDTLPERGSQRGSREGEPDTKSDDHEETGDEIPVDDPRRSSGQMSEERPGVRALVTATIVATAVVSPGVLHAQAENTGMGDVKTPAPTLSGHVEANGVDYYYAIYGEGEPLLLLHGGLGAIEMFGPVLSELAAERRVIGVDLHGHGRTALGDRPLDYVDMGDDLAVILGELGFDRVDVMGYSMGGAVALRLAIQHPEAVRRLVVASAGFARDGVHPDLLPMQAAVGAGMAESMVGTPMHATYMELAPRPEDFPRLLDNMGELMRRPFDWSEEVKALEMPAMLVYGDSDMLRPEHVVEFYKLLGGGLRDPGWMREHMAQNRLAILPDLTHYEVFLAPELVRTVLPFLNGVSRSPTWTGPGTEAPDGR